MTAQQILQKAIQKAIDGGWRSSERMQTFISTLLVGTQIIEVTDAYGQIWFVNDIIFNHDFARALWGDKKIYITGDDIGDGWVALLHPTIERYKYHLQQMVIAEDPIKYLGENMP